MGITGLWVLAATLVAGLVAGLVMRSRNGRVRAGKGGPSSALPEPVVAALDAETPVTLVQISTTFCAPCRHTRALLSSLADRTEGLRHVELDVTEQPEVARQLGVLRTPTTLALDTEGRELLRVGGLPKTPELLDALKPHLPVSETAPSD